MCAVAVLSLPDLHNATLILWMLPPALGKTCCLQCRAANTLSHPCLIGGCDHCIGTTN